ncbi:DUF1840 domain-containing protein [Fluoribacter dumoffii]|uniref:Domain of uncharacterized function (DUF1840) n=1 Tax=Fluoribacter dumoffii TaxID=463 RepID=A0A377GDB9_9GAMM|nr:DUF1840 domain-containing protein [Fluoribacter dumoffii]KTC90888.1 hypothetical protein Ldum_1956 [Fluoribacter dumoffii NY 23]MCW8386458.1 DUF1840 domain-containing protein [Fluoribacter dumoffii]MCW8419511.1 DUF1840 domain-containing protein [Fluoribacter dumoffii]MCW8455786.1 DUF1840 domain-containing protein [Fluoribacter dumoffii]MCW8460135.1 DUF1840 domain-containing protein [Fluoribacter dumoffii]
MLITFHTDAYEDITYFADVAKRLLSLMGHSGTIPGAIKAENLPEALEKLQAGLKGEKKGVEEDEDNEPVISLANRAVPLINLLQAAIKKDKDVLWD